MGKRIGLVLAIVLSSTTAWAGQQGGKNVAHSRSRVPKAIVVDAGNISARPQRPSAVVEIQRSALVLRHERTPSFIRRIGARLARSPL